MALNFYMFTIALIKSVVKLFKNKKEIIIYFSEKMVIS